MLTVEMLLANAALAGLTEEQRTAIAEMSRNDENVVIGNRIGELHRQYDTDVLSVTGLAKEGQEKSYDYVKRVLGEYKTQIVKLTKQVADGNTDEAIKQQLKDSKAQVSQLQKQLETKEAAHKKAEDALRAEIQTAHVDYAFKAVTDGLKFKAEIPESVRGTLISAAKAEVLAKGTPEFKDGSLVFRGADGNVLNNPSNNLNPFTLQELLQQTSIKDVLDLGRQLPGGGTVPPTNITPPTGDLIDLTGAKTQVEADKAIEAHLLANGLTRDSSEFAERALQMRTENKVAELPIR